MTDCAINVTLVCIEAGCHPPVLTLTPFNNAAVKVGTVHFPPANAPLTSAHQFNSNNSCKPSYDPTIEHLNVDGSSDSAFLRYYTYALENTHRTH